LAQFADQPRILHRDSRLRREVLEQRDLLVGEWAYGPAICGDRAEKPAILAQRHDQKSANADFHRDPQLRVDDTLCGDFRYIGDVDNLLATHDPGEWIVA